MNRSMADALRSWHTLDDVIMNMSEPQLRAAIEHERTGQAREHILVRLHMRLTRLRSDRERKRLIAGLADWEGER